MKVNYTKDMFKDGDYLPDSEYILLSKSEHIKESYVFPCDEQGNITSLRCLVETDYNWTDSDYVIDLLSKTTKHNYEFVKYVMIDDNGITQKLYKCIS